MSSKKERLDDSRRIEIRRLNDEFRKHPLGRGTVLLTAGVRALGDAAAVEAVTAVRDFSAFSEANDPHGEHDFGAFEVADERLFWKIDYYDLSLKAHSPDPADAAVTRRVLTIMLASEY